MHADIYPYNIYIIEINYDKLFNFNELKWKCFTYLIAISFFLSIDKYLNLTIAQGLVLEVEMNAKENNSIETPNE